MVDTLLTAIGIRTNVGASTPLPGCSMRIFTHRLMLAGALLLATAVTGNAQAPTSDLTRLLERELSQYPARAGVYVKNLKTGEEAGVGADASFNSASVIKLAIMVRAFQLADAGRLDLDERVEIRRADIRPGSGVFQYHTPGLRPTVSDLIVEMIITSDNTATDMLVTRVGGVDSLNHWLAASGFTNTQVIGPGHMYRRRVLAAFNPLFTNLTAEETTGLEYAETDNPLFELYTPLFTGERAAWVAIMRDPEARTRLSALRRRLTIDDRAFWLAAMTPRETGRLLEGIERGTLASAASTARMKVMLRRQQLGARRIPHYLTVPVGHKTGDSPVIANDVGLIYSPSGTLVVAFFTNGVKGSMGETEDRIGRTARAIVDYYNPPAR